MLESIQKDTMDEQCLIYRTLELLGKKWVALILFEFCPDPSKKVRYMHIKSALPAITPKILSHCLDALVEHGILAKSIDNGTVPIRTEYKLTAHGTRLIPIIAAIKSYALSTKDCPHKEICNKCEVL